jgi:hypothetical protein
MRIANCPFIVLTPGNSAQFLERKRAVQVPGNADLQAFLDPRCRRSTACHAEGRGFESLQPLRERPSIRRSFCCAQSACASASGRTDSGLAAGRSSAAPRKTPCLQVDSGSSEPKSFCGPAEGHVFGLLRPLPRLLLRRHDPADSARWRVTRVAVLGGQSGFSPETARSTSPVPRPGEPWPQRRELSPQNGIRGSGAVPITGASVAAVTRGHRRRCRFPSASRRPRAPGLAC